MFIQTLNGNVRRMDSIRGFKLDDAKMEFFRGIINYIEDRRIDSIVFKSSLITRLYHSLYQKYFNGKKVAKVWFSDVS